MSLKIINGRVIDGCGNPWYRTNILIEGDTITRMGVPADVKADEVIDARDKIVCPGFFELHTAADDFVHPINKEKALELLAGKVYMGVTTGVGGNCGYSPFPLSKEFGELWKAACTFIDAGISWEWTDLESYYRFIEKNGLCMNHCCYIGHGATRVAVMGFDPSIPNKEQMKKMGAYVEQAMQQGALGMSSGLIYPPGMWTTTEELVELCKIVKKYGGIYASHIRGESENLFDATRELIAIGEKAGLPVHNSHIEAWGKHHFWKVPTVLGMIDEAREIRGVDVTFDTFTYAGANTSITALYPPWAMEGGIPELVKRLKDPKLRQRMLEDITALGKNLDVWPHNIGGNSGDLAHGPRAAGTRTLKVRPSKSTEN